MSDYPIPSYAAYIWVVGDQIWLGFPPIGDGIQSHSVPFPATEVGIQLIVKTLKERGQGNKHLGLKGSPTRYAIERELVNDQRYITLLNALRKSREVTEAQRKESEDFLKEYGL